MAPVLIVLVTFVAYVPAMRGGFIWSDDTRVTDNQTLRTADGLRRIWLEPGAVPQYYPLNYTSYWIEYHFWGLWPRGYHVVNVCLHAVNAILVWRVLRRLRIAGACLGALIFALHPVHVESVAWIFERTNVLSGAFYLSAALAYMHFCPLEGDGPTGGYRWRFYAPALALFVCGLLSKTVTCSLPAALLVLMWWKRSRLKPADLLPLVPFFVLGIVSAVATIWLETHRLTVAGHGARGAEWDLSIVQRFLIAGRALWFYAGKLFWPHGLTFIYARWQISPGTWWQYVFPLGAAAVAVTLWLLRGRIGKGPLTAVLVFAGTLFPTLGFFNIYFMQHSFVADHFQYLASLGLIALFVAVAAAAVRRLGQAAAWVAPGASVLVAGLLAASVFRQARIYEGKEALWRDTIARNPACWVAHNNLGAVLADEGKAAEAITHYAVALRIRPDASETHYNLANLLVGRGRLDEGISHYREAVRLEPGFPDAHNNLGTALARRGDITAAITHFGEAVRMRPGFAMAHNNLGTALLSQGRLDEAISEYRKVLQSRPGWSLGHYKLGLALERKGIMAEAVEEYRQALRIDPLDREARASLESALARSGER